MFHGRQFRLTLFCVGFQLRRNNNKAIIEDPTRFVYLSLESSRSTELLWGSKYWSEQPARRIYSHKTGNFPPRLSTTLGLTKKLDFEITPELSHCQDERFCLRNRACFFGKVSPGRSHNYYRGKRLQRQQQWVVVPR